MNELDLVRGVAMDTPGPDAATTQAARARLLAVITTEAEEAGQARPTGRRRGTRRSASRGRRPWLLPGGVVVAAVLAVVLTVPLLQRPATTPSGPATTITPASTDWVEPTAAGVLTDLALAAARTPTPTLGPGRYWHVLQRGVMVGTNYDNAGSRKSFFYRFHYERETWWALDGSLSGQLRNGPAQFLNGTERAAWVAAGRPDLGLPNTERYSPNERQLVAGIGWLPSSYQDLVELPTNPMRLLAALSERIRTYQPPGLRTYQRHPNQPHQLFGTIAYLLEHYPLPAALRAALYQALTRLDGVELVGEVTDLAGRRAVSVAIGVDQSLPESLPERHELLLDPATGRLLGARSVLTRTVPGWRLPVGTVIDQNVLLEASVVDSRTTRPAAATQTP
jgi:hypothetical protein